MGMMQEDEEELQRQMEL
jgi:hypothetical protein